MRKVKQKNLQKNLQKDQIVVNVLVEQRNVALNQVVLLQADLILAQEEIRLLKEKLSNEDQKSK